MSFDHSSFACATRNCGATIWLNSGEEARMRRTHETFYCSAGHENYFAGKTSEQQRIAALEAQLATANGQARYWERRAEDNDRRCPWSGCGRYLSDDRARHIHMIRAHGMPPLYVVRAEQEAAS